ncbi:AMP-binding protein, partial [Frankia sp. AvcI1]|uniref:AMP-binding protein n=1 Tax=Frankia sp. AvcI1 TaxID=573496 RepID=UPI001F326BAD
MISLCCRCEVRRRAEPISVRGFRHGAGSHYPQSWSDRVVLTADSTWELVEARAAASPDGLAVIDEHRRHLTFRELRDRAEAAAVRLRAHGVGPGSVVSWQLPNTIDTVVVCLALARLGAVQNPLIMMLREREITFV